MPSPIILIELVTPHVPVEPLLKDKSWILSGVSSHYDLRVYVFGAPDIRKDASLGTHFEYILPKNGNRFELELGVVLPDLFPNLEEKPEYSLTVVNNDAQREICFSNVMALLRFTRNGHQIHALIPRRALGQLQAGKIEFAPKDASVELLRTFATSRFLIQGRTAEEAWESHCESCIHEFIESLNRILKALPFADDAEGRVYSMAYSRANLPSLYFILKGASDDQLGHGWISTHVGRTMLNPPNLTPEAATKLGRYLNGTTTIDDIQSLLHSAQTFADGGVIEYVLLLIVIAAEVATQRFVHGRLQSAQVSKTKLEAVEKDLTYSLMINVVLFAVTPVGHKPDLELIGKMNRARSLRNDYMHDGTLPSDQKEILDLYTSTKKYVEYLRDLDRLVGSNAVVPSDQPPTAS